MDDTIMRARLLKPVQAYSEEGTQMELLPAGVIVDVYDMDNNWDMYGRLPNGHTYSILRENVEVYVDFTAGDKILTSILYKGISDDVIALKRAELAEEHNIDIEDIQAEVRGI